MDIVGTYSFAARPETVWQVICDPVVLKQSIPQCESMERISESQWKGTARVKVGPFSTLFNGLITLTDIDPPHSYTIGIEADSWLGHSSGTARVRLVANETGTRLSYEATVHTGIKLLDKAMNLATDLAQTLADKFFSRLAVSIEQREKESHEKAV